MMATLINLTSIKHKQDFITNSKLNNLTTPQFRNEEKLNTHAFKLIPNEQFYLLLAKFFICFISLQKKKTFFIVTIFT